MLSAVPSMSIGSANAARTRAASSVGPMAGILDQDRELVAAQPGRRVGGPQALLEPARDLGQQRSPATWPSESLTVLKSSRSMNRIDGTTPRRRRRAIACSTRFWKRARLASPVSES
jgi:hypothetical protein